MAKKLLATNYDFDIDNDQITISGFYRQEQFLLITDVSNGNIIYNFADATKGATGVSFDENTEKTTITLETDLSAFGVDSTSKLQILVDHPEVEMEVSDALLDPVHKIRVSNPQNLIDTDFEYGLQPTKWETLELSNNVPSFYVGDGDIPLSIVDKVEAVEGSDNITVTCTDEHGLVIGTPIDISGLDFRTAEGKFLISAVTSTTFVYKANAVSTVSGEIGSIYTSITPGSFYAGSQINYNTDTGLQTDEAASSGITVTTPDKHGFVPDMNFYLVNSIGGKKLNLTQPTTDTVSDSRARVDPANFINTSFTPTAAKMHTTQIRGNWSHYFDSTAVDTASNTITWPGHNLRTNYCLIYNPPAGGAEIGGLRRFDIYYVRFVDNDTIQLSETYNGGAISLTSAGDTSYSEHNLHLVYEIYRSYAPYRNSWTYHYTWSYGYGSNASGWDMRTYSDGSYGLGGTAYGHMMMTRQYNYPADSQRWLSYYTPEYHQYNTAYGGNQTYWRFPEYDPSAAQYEPSRWNPLEDFTRFSSYNWTGYKGPVYNSRYFLNQKYYYSGTYNYYWGNKRVFMFPFIIDNEADTFYSPNHGLVDGGNVSITTTSGSQIRTSTSTTSINNGNSNTNLSDGSYKIEVASADRFRLSDHRIVQAKGAYNMVGQRSNPTANTFFVEDHGLLPNQTVKFDVEAGGAAPATDTGALEPVATSSVSTGNNAAVFSTLNTAIDDYLTTSMTGHTTFRMASGNGNNYDIATTGYASGTSPINYIRTYYTTYWHYVYKNGSTVDQGYAHTPNLFVNKLNSTTPTNIFADGNYPNMVKYNFTAMATDFVANSDVNFYLMVHQAGDRAYGTGPSDYWRGYRYTVDYLSNGGMSFYGNATGQYRTLSVNGDTYQYEYTYRTFRENNRTVCHIKWRFWNDTQWETNGGNTQNPYYGSNNYNYTYYTDSGLAKNHIECDLWFFGDQTLAANSTTQIDSLLNSVITDFSNNFTKPALTDGQSFDVSVVDNNRFELKKNGIPIDITTSGTAPLSFSLQKVVGAADGAYKSGLASDNYFTLDVPFQVTGNEEVLNSGLIDSDNNIPITGGHPFITGTAVEYTADVGGALSNLTDGSEYFVRAVDDEHIQLMATAEDAITGENAIDVDADAGINHSIKTTSVAGVVQAEGSVNVTEGSKAVIGEQSLFKRYFKIGDSIIIKDNNETPGSLSEFTIAAIADDEKMEVTETPGFTATSTKHFAKTNVYTKTDGYSVHRPFDGGVEIGAGTAPYGQITRQTRKYFRYQSGKGIQTSLAINFNPPVTFESLAASGTTVTGKTKYPHRLSAGQLIQVSNSTDNSYNGFHNVASIINDYEFTYTLSSTPSTSIPGGIIQFTVEGYSGSVVRAGMFDAQNGFFFEWDGNTLNCVRRSSTTQLSGTVKATKNRGIIEGTGTNFTGQLQVRDKVVIRGQTYTIVSIENRTTLYVQPQYRGVTTDGIVMTKTEDVRVPQEEWNLDRCDGTGKEGFVINTSKIQMAYMDYSWYGAGKIRFGFKDRKGHVRYVHEFIHNNRLDEAYMRSGNLPAKYEIENDLNPTYAPTLFHWGTSVIMDGTFDEDEAYLFTAPSQSLSFTNGQSNTATTNASSSLTYQYNRGTRQYDFYVRLNFSSNDASKFSTGTKLYTTGGELNGEEVAYTSFSGSTLRVHIYISSGRSFPSPGTYPVVNSGTVVNVGAPASGGSDVNLGTAIIPLVSLRLAPSVDNNLTGNLGERDIINRMQLKLQEIGLILTHDCEVKLILNGDISTVAWENVASPSLSQLIKHNSGDGITGGTEVFSFRAAGGGTDNTGKRLSNTSNFSLSAIIDMGNSILGGDGTFPNGPDILSVAVQVTDTNGITAASPFAASARITWAESQA